MEATAVEDKLISAACLPSPVDLLLGQASHDDEGCAAQDHSLPTQSGCTSTAQERWVQSRHPSRKPLASGGERSHMWSRLLATREEATAMKVKGHTTKTDVYERRATEWQRLGADTHTSNRCVFRSRLQVTSHWPKRPRDGRWRRASFCGIEGGATPSWTSAPKKRKNACFDHSSDGQEEGALSCHRRKVRRLPRGTLRLTATERSGETQGVLRRGALQTARVKGGGHPGPGLSSAPSADPFFWANGHRHSAKPAHRCWEDAAPCCAPSDHVISHIAMSVDGHSTTSDARPSTRPPWLPHSSFHAEQSWDAIFKGAQPQSEGGWPWRQISQHGAAKTSSARSSRTRLARHAQGSSNAGTEGSSVDDGEHWPARYRRLAGRTLQEVSRDWRFRSCASRTKFRPFARVSR